MILSAPVIPYRGTRDMDVYGSGAFAASRDGGTRAHRGRDYLAVPGDDVVSPIDGVVMRHVIAYPGADLTGIEIDGPTCRVKMLYLRPEVPVGRRVHRGERIGSAQDVAAYWQRKEPRQGGMKGHIHLELMIWIDPETTMEHGPVTA